MTRLVLFLLISALRLPPSAFPQTLLGATGSLANPHGTGELYSLTSSGGVIQDIGPLNDARGNNYALTGMDFLSGVLYGVTAGGGTSPNSLVTIDPATGAVQFIGALGTRATDVVAVNGALYCVSGSSKFFYSINLTTGAAIRLGDTGLTPQDGGALGADANGDVFGATLRDQTTGAIGFYRYDLTTGAATYIGDTGETLFPRALAGLVGIEGGTLGNPSKARFIGSYDTATGLWTQTGQTVDYLDALAFLPIPEPRSFVLLGTASIVALLFSRRILLNRRTQ